MKRSQRASLIEVVGLHLYTARDQGYKQNLAHQADDCGAYLAKLIKFFRKRHKSRFKSLPTTAFITPFRPKNTEKLNGN